MTYDERASLFERDRWRCPCGRPSTQVAHRIPNSKYGKGYIYRALVALGLDPSATMVLTVLWHPRNLRTVCSLDCNHRESISNHPLDMGTLVEEIVYELEWL